jgi:hypothetical protein
VVQAGGFVHGRGRCRRLMEDGREMGFSWGDYPLLDFRGYPLIASRGQAGFVSIWWLIVGIVITVIVPSRGIFAAIPILDMKAESGIVLVSENIEIANKSISEEKIPYGASKIVSESFIDCPAHLTFKSNNYLLPWLDDIASSPLRDRHIVFSQFSSFKQKITLEGDSNSRSFPMILHQGMSKYFVVPIDSFWISINAPFLRVWHFVNADIGSQVFFGGITGYINLPHTSDSENESKNCNGYRGIQDAPIIRRFLLFIIGVFGGLLVCLAGIGKFHNNRRAIGAALLLVGFSIGVGGIILWFMTALQSSWDWPL